MLRVVGLPHVPLEHKSQNTFLLWGAAVPINDFILRSNLLILRSVFCRSTTRTWSEVFVTVFLISCFGTFLRSELNLSKWVQFFYRVTCAHQAFFFEQVANIFEIRNCKDERHSTGFGLCCDINVHTPIVMCRIFCRRLSKLPSHVLAPVLGEIN